MILSSIWGQKFLVFTILSVSVSGEQDTSQLGYGSSDLGYGPLHPGENSVQAQKAALSSYASNSDRHSGGMSPFSSGGTSMSSSGTGSMGQGGSRMSSPFSANSGGSGMQIPVTASSGSSPNGGTAAGPFSSATGGQGSSGGMASSPFSVAGLGNGGGMGSNPFSTGSGSGTGSGPFSASSNLGGSKFSSFLTICQPMRHICLLTYLNKQTLRILWLDSIHILNYRKFLYWDHHWDRPKVLLQTTSNNPRCGSF